MASGDKGRFNSDQARYEPRAGAQHPPQPAPWRDREDARYDRDRTGHGHGEPQARLGDDRDLWGYGGQAYGLEGGPSHQEDDQERGPGLRGEEDARETWRAEHGAPYGDLELNARNRGVERYGPPHDYAYHPPAGHELDPDRPEDCKREPER